MALSPELAAWRRTRRTELLDRRMAVDAAQRRAWNTQLTD
ncbi:MAG: hypothetical protein KDH18_24100, partial [Rhodoferax sp.]|nr:hypothetical protein [Rhodoferax sp.]